MPQMLENCKSNIYSFSGVFLYLCFLFNIFHITTISLSLIREWLFSEFIEKKLLGVYTSIMIQSGTVYV